MASSTIFWVFGMTWHGIEPWSPRPLAWLYNVSLEMINLRILIRRKAFYPNLAGGFSFIGDMVDIPWIVTETKNKSIFNSY